jgi:4-aminobutyrate aminotransferase-like enzyme
MEPSHWPDASEIRAGTKMSKTVANDLMSDPRIAQAKKLLLETLTDHQQMLTGIRASDPQLKQPYVELLEQFAEIRGAKLFFPYLGSGIGRGPLVELADGSVKYDFISGIGVHYWGHSSPALVAASVDAALQDTVMQGNLQQNTQGVFLAREILNAAKNKGASLNHCFFATSGAMANENALKIIFQKKSPADRILAFEGCFMGRTLALSSITDKPEYRQGLPATLPVDYVPFFDPEQPEESTKESVDSLNRYLARYPGRHAVMCFELILGEGGFHLGQKNFFTSLMKILKQNNIAIFIDEIQTFGRTEELFAFQYFGLDDFVDVVTIGKLSQVCATLFKADYNPQPGLVSQTFTGGTAAFFAGRVIIRELIEGGFFGPDGKIAQYHQYFVNRLENIQKRHPTLITGPFGFGAMIAFTPLDGSPKKVKEFIQALFEAGVISFYGGTDLTRVRFLIPVGALTLEDIDSVANIVEETLLHQNK